MGSKSSSSPNYRKAAEETAAGNLELAKWEMAANRPNMYTPWGAQTYSGTPGQPGYSTEITLSPQQQRALDSQMALQQGRSDIGLGLMGRAGSEMQTPGDFWNTLPSVGGAPNVPDFYGQGLSDMGRGPDPGMLGRGLMSGQGPDVQDREQFDTQAGYDPAFADTAFKRQMSLVGPTHAAKTEALDVQLRNQGLVPGTEAYDSAVAGLRTQQGEEINRLSADAVGRGQQEQQAQYLRELQSSQFGLGAGQQRFGQEQSLAQFLEAQRGGRFGEQGAQFGAGMSSAQYADAQRQQQAQEQMGFGQMGFDQQMQQSQLQNQIRQAGIAEQLQREGWSLNKINAMLSGQQVGMPTMPNFNPVSRPAGADYLGAAGMQGQADSAASGNLWGTVGAIGGGLAGGPFGTMIGNKIGNAVGGGAPIV